MSVIAEAFDRASGVKTPWNPSRKAIKRVLNPLPAPTVCPHCGGEVQICSNDVIYGRKYGDWPWAYVCMNQGQCDAYVGMLPFTNIPLGTLATREIREARKLAKAAFNPLWQGDAPRFNRSEAYQWLASQLGIEKETCHVGWFDVAMCQKVVLVCKVKL